MSDSKRDIRRIVKSYTNIDAFFVLVRAGLWEKDAQLSQFGKADYEEIMHLAEEQSVVGLVLAGLEHSDVKPPKKLLLQWIGEAQLLEQRNKAMNQFIADLVVKMRNADIYTILVKGQGIAQCYERPFWRACGDVDLLLNDDNYKKAATFLQPLTTNVEKEQKFNKHIAMTIDSWEVELHGSLRGGLWKEMDYTLDEVMDSVFYGGKVRTWGNGKTQVFLLNADEDVVYVFAHILEHFYYGGIGLRQICDWCRLLWIFREELDMRLLKSRLRNMGAMTEWKAFGALAVDYLGMPVEAMPFYNARFRDRGERILKFVMYVGNFGHNRDRSYYKKEPYLRRKAISFWRHTRDSLTFLLIFPMDAMRMWKKMLVGGIKAVSEKR